MEIKFIQKADWNLIIGILIVICIILIVISFVKMTSGFWTNTLGLNASMLPFVD